MLRSIWLPRTINNKTSFCEVFFDRQDTELMFEYFWHISHQGYLATLISTGPVLSINRKNILFHRLVISAPDDMVVHHINLNTLNNCRDNLIIMTNSQHVGLHRLIAKCERDNQFASKHANKTKQLRAMAEKFVQNDNLRQILKRHYSVREPEISKILGDAL